MAVLVPGTYYLKERQLLSKMKAGGGLCKKFFAGLSAYQRYSGEHRAWTIYLSVSSTIIFIFEMTNYYGYYVNNYEGSDPFSVSIIYMWVLSCGLFFVVQGSDPGYYHFVNDTDVEAAGLKNRKKMKDSDKDKHDDELANDFSRFCKFCKLKITRVTSNILFFSRYLKTFLSKTERFDEIASVNSHSNKDLLVYCNICNKHLPHRSYHCKTCKRCVSTYDHHCHIIGTCIGESNHARFYFFLLYVSYGTLKLLFCVLNQKSFRLSARGRQFGAGVQLQGLLDSKIVLEIMVFIQYSYTVTLALISVGFVGLVSYQTFLIATNILGHEYLSSSFPNSAVDPLDAPYSEGVFVNLIKFIFIRDQLFLKLFLDDDWKPTYWKAPVYIDYSSLEISQNCCRNKHYSCC